MMVRFQVWIVAGFMMYGCSKGQVAQNVSEFHPADDRFWEVLPRESYMERIGIEFEFTEGPVWHPGGYLLFTDIPANTIYQWSGQRFTVYSDSSNQANGLLLEPGGSLLACEHQSRCVARYSTEGTREVLADRYLGRRLNSPNDLCRSFTGTLYFTDPPWGLPLQNEDPLKEIPFSGVYMLRNGELSLIDSTLSWPNGIALSPDEKSLFVANMEMSQEGADTVFDIFWMRYRLDETGKPLGKEVFYRAGDPELPGGPDGMKVDQKGNLFVTGPGGILVIDPKGILLGTIEVPIPATNLAFGPREKELFITARSTVFRLVFNQGK
jgi:gluconolactonase